MKKNIIKKVILYFLKKNSKILSLRSFMWFLSNTNFLQIISITTKLKSSNKFVFQKKTGERYQNLSKEGKEKKAAIWSIWSWTLQKSFRRWKTTACIEKNIIERENKMLYSFLSFICNYYSEQESLKAHSNIWDNFWHLKSL